MSKSKMGLKADKAGSADLDALMAEVDGGSKPEPKKTAPKTAASEPKSATSRKPASPKETPPWEEGSDTLKPIAFKVSEADHMRLNYIKDATGVPIQRILQDFIGEQIRERAGELWKKK